MLTSGWPAAEALGADRRLNGQVLITGNCPESRRDHGVSHESETDATDGDFTPTDGHRSPEERRPSWGVYFAEAGLCRSIANEGGPTLRALPSRRLTLSGSE